MNKIDQRRLGSSAVGILVRWQKERSVVRREYPARPVLPVNADLPVNPDLGGNAARWERRAQRANAARAASSDRASLAAEVNGHIETIYKELDVQMKRMSQIQQQVDELRMKIKLLSE